MAFDANLKGSVGGALLDQEGIPLRFFSENIPALVMKRFLEVSDNPIYLIELLAGYIAAFLWGGLTTGRYVVMYIDNEASRLALSLLLNTDGKRHCPDVCIQRRLITMESLLWSCLQLL